MADKKFTDFKGVQLISDIVITALDKLKALIGKKVDKVDGKGLSTNDLTNELLDKINKSGTSNFSGNYSDLVGSPTNVSFFTNDAKYQTDTQVAEAVAKAGHINKEIVDVLPSVSEAKDNTIYLVLDKNGTDGNSYIEYMVINGKWEMIGSTKIDLTNYLKDTDNLTNAEIENAMASLVNYNAV